MTSKKPRSRQGFRRIQGRKRGRPLELIVKIKSADKKKLKELLSRGRESVRVIKRALVLQAQEEGKSPAKAAEAVGVSLSTAERTARRYLEGGLQRALWEAPRPGKERTFKPRQAQQLVAMLCGPSPSGRARWTIRLAAEEIVKRGVVPKAGRETVRVVMCNHSLKPWREKNVVHTGTDTGVRGKNGGRA